MQSTQLILALIALCGIKIAKTIVVPEDGKLTRKDNPTINPKERENYADTRELSRTIPCLSKFVETYFDLQPYRVPVLLPENVTDTLEFTPLYLSALQRLTSTYVLSGELDPEADHLTTLNGIILVEDYDELLAMQTTLINLCGRDCKYLMVLTRTFPDEESFIKECSRLVLKLWSLRIANVVFLSAVGHTVLVSRSLTFEPRIICVPAKPVIVAECDENSNWSASKWDAVSEMYLSLRMNDCTVVVAFFDYEPYVTGKEVSSTTWSYEDLTNGTSNTTAQSTSSLELMGIEGLIVNTLASSLRFTIKAMELPWLNATTMSEEVNEALWSNDEVDMVLGGLRWSPEEETVYTLPYEVVQIVWLVPIRPNVSLQGLVAPLDKHVWFAVLGLLIFASCVELILTRNVPFLEILSLVIGHAWPKQPSVLSSRIRFISWVIFGYILAQFYLASLAGQLMASSGLQIETLAELAGSNFDIGGTSDIRQFFESDDMGDFNVDGIDDNEVNRIITGRFKALEHKEYMRSFDDLIHEKNDKLALAVRMNVSSMKPSFADKRVHRMKEALASYPLSFAVWRGMPYLSVLDRKIGNLIEAGVIGYWARMISLEDGGYYDTESHEDENNLDLISLAPGFLLLIMGYGLAGLALLMEVVVFRWRNRKRAKDKTVKSKTKPKTERIKVVPMTRIDQRVGKKFPDVGDTEAWIEILRKTRQYRTPVRRDGVRKVEFPFEFVH